MLEQIQPLYDRVVVKRIKETQTKGGIILPDEGAGCALVQGSVIAVGNGKISMNGMLIPLTVKVGDIICFNRQNEIEAEEDYALLREESLVGIVKDIEE